METVYEGKLKEIQQQGIFTAGQSFDQFVSELCKRYFRIYGEILPVYDYKYIVDKLEEKGILDEDELN